MLGEFCLRERRHFWVVREIYARESRLYKMSIGCWNRKRGSWKLRFGGSVRTTVKLLRKINRNTVEYGLVQDSATLSIYNNQASANTKLTSGPR